MPCGLEVNARPGRCIIADNLVANPGSGGATFRTDDLGGAPAVHVPFTKILLGGDGVDGGAAPGDGANGIDVDVTRLPALVAGTANIGDVDVLTVPAPLSTTGGGTEATALRVTVASDSTGVLSVDDNGGSLTVDGTVSVSGTVTVDTELPAAETPADNLTNATAAPRVNSLGYAFDGTTWDRMRGDSTDGLLVNLGTNNDVVVSGTVSVNQPVAVTDNSGSLTVDASSWPLPTGASTLAEQQTQTTSLQLIDDAIVADNAAFTDGTTKLDMAGFIFDEVAGTALAENDAAAARIDSKRAQVISIEDASTRGLRATIRDLASNDALNVAIVDGSGNQITSFGGGTQYTEDAAAAADPVGTVPILVRKDTPAAITSTDGDNIAQRGTNYGAAYVQVVNSSGAFIDTFGGSGGTAQADESSFVEGTTNMTPIGGVLNDTITSDPTEDQAAAVRITAKRAFHTNLRANDGTELATAGAPLRVDPTGTTTQPISAASLPLPTGAATAANQLPNSHDVTIDNASGAAAVNIQDGGNVITVDGAVTVSGTATVTQSADWVVIGTDAHDAAISGDPVTVGGRASAAAPTDVSADGDAVRAWHLRNGAQATVITAAGALIGGDAANGLDVDITRSVLPTGASTLAEQQTQTTSLQLIDDVVHSGDAALSKYAVLGAVFDDVSTATVTENNAQSLRMTSGRALHVSVQSAIPAGTNNIGDVDVLTVPAPLNVTGGGTEAAALRVTIANDSTGLVSVDDNGGSLTVDGTVSVSGTVTVADNQTITDNAAFTDGTSKVLMAGFAFDETAGTALTENDAAAARIDSKRAIVVTLEDATTRGTRAGVTANGLAVQQATAANFNAQVVGAVADDAAASGNPLSIGLTARQTNRTAVADGDHVRAAADDMGRQLVVMNQVRDLVTDATTTISTTTETTILAAAASTFHDLTLLVITNTSATAVRVDIRDTTAGTIRLSIAIAANGGAVIPFAVPRPQGTVNTNWTAQLSAAVTDVRIYAQAVKNV